MMPLDEDDYSNYDGIGVNMDEEIDESITPDNITKDFNAEWIDDIDEDQYDGDNQVAEIATADAIDQNAASFASVYDVVDLLSSLKKIKSCKQFLSKYFSNDDMDEDGVIILSKLLLNGFNLTNVPDDESCFIASIIICMGKRTNIEQVKSFKKTLLNMITTKNLKQDILDNFNICERGSGLGAKGTKNQVPLWEHFRKMFMRHDFYFPQSMYMYVECAIQATILVVDITCNEQKIGLLSGFHNEYRPEDKDRHFVLLLYTAGYRGHFNTFTRMENRRIKGRFQYQDLPDAVKLMLVDDLFSTPPVVALFKRVAQLN